MSAEMVKNPKQKFSVMIRQERFQELINQTLGDQQRAARFVASVSSAVAVNPALQECTAGTILTAALLGETLNLVPSPQLGQYYLVPFKDKKKDKDGKTIWLRDSEGKIVKDEKGRYVAETESHAVFVLGYKGYIQLAIRSGYYRNINVLEVKDGEFIAFNPFTEEFNASWISDPADRALRETVGYVAMFEYLNGFRKIIYWTKEQMMLHADRYSPAFSAETYKRILAGDIPDSEMWKYSSFWYKDFDAMAKKTMIRQLISHWGVMSPEMQTAFERDNSAAEVAQNGTTIPISSDETDADPEVGDPFAESVPEQDPEAVPAVHLEPVEQVNLDDV